MDLDGLPSLAGSPRAVPDVVLTRDRAASSPQSRSTFSELVREDAIGTRLAMPGIHGVRMHRPAPQRRAVFHRPEEELYGIAAASRALPGSTTPGTATSAAWATTGPSGRRLTVKQDEADDVTARNPMQAEGEINFLDVVDMDRDEVFATYVQDELVGRLVESSTFRLLVFGVIVLNTVLIGLQTDTALNKQFTGVLSGIDSVFLTVYIIEILLKWYNGFFAYWKVGWNVFDFVIVAASLLGPSITFLSSGRVLRILRVIRAFRTLRSISVLQGLQVIVQTIIRSLPDMANILLLLLIMMFIFSVVGVTVFGQVLPQYFGDFGSNMFTLFILTTQDGWANIFNLLAEKGMYGSGAIYMAMFITVGAFIFANIIVGVTVTNLQVAYDEISRMRKSRFRKLRKHSKTTGMQASLPVAQLKVEPEVWKHQHPVEVPDFHTITTSHLENYFLVLSAMEENLAEYQTLKTKLEAITDQVRELNFSLHSGEGEAVSESSSDSSDDDEGDEVELQLPGDVLSSMIRANERRAQTASKKKRAAAAAPAGNDAPALTQKDNVLDRTENWARGNDAVAALSRTSSAASLASRRSSSSTHSAKLLERIARRRSSEAHSRRTDGSMRGSASVRAQASMLSPTAEDTQRDEGGDGAGSGSGSEDDDDDAGLPNAYHEPKPQMSTSPRRSKPTFRRSPKSPRG